jgi:hypothetical protein
MHSTAALRTWAQRRRQDAYYPDSMSRQARRLAEMRAVLDYWHQRTGPATGWALDAASMIAIADRACRDLAGGIIGEGCAA